MILAGDVGGTKTLLALLADADEGAHPVREATFASREHGSLEALVNLFLATAPGEPLRAACFGVPGLVIDGRCHTTNLPWVLDERELAAALRCPRVRLLNDVQATAFGTLHLQPDEICVLHRGIDRAGHIAVVAAGTGLGEAVLYWDGTRHHPVASEGGHADFAPRTDQEIALLRYLRGKYGEHVSWERVLSGPGLRGIYAFLRDTGAAAESPQLAERLRAGDPSAVIAECGLSGADALCVAALEQFVSLYGAEAGNWALKCLALGGVFLAGGIAPKLLPALQRGAFMRAFVDKGRFAELLESLSVRVALSARTPLIGAAHFARRSLD